MSPIHLVKPTIDALIAKIKPQFQADTSGHDWDHLQRVLNLANYIAEHERQAYDPLVLQATALTHDIGDHKFLKPGETQAKLVTAVLTDLPGLTQAQLEKIVQGAQEISFLGSHVADRPTSYEAIVVQDADRLDAMGAIGIARAFTVGATLNRKMYDPDIPITEAHTAASYKQQKTGTTINHFYEKLLLIKDRLHTKTAKKIGEKRHQLMLAFLEEFMNEWKSEIK